MSRLQRVILVVEAILAVWLTWPVGILLIGVSYFVYLMAAAEREYRRRSIGWSEQGFPDRAQQEKSKYTLTKALRISATCAAVGLALVFIYKLGLILFKGHSTEKVLLGVFLGLLLLYWCETLVTTVRQSELNRSMLSLLKSVQLRDEKVIDTALITEAKEFLASKATVVMLLLYPWKCLNESVGLARKLAARLEFVRRMLTAEEKAALAELQNKQMKILAYRMIEKGSCRHREAYYFSNEETPFSCIEHQIVGNEIRQIFWCKYCLVSLRYRRQVPVIVKPPY